VCTAQEIEVTEAKFRIADLWPISRKKPQTVICPQQRGEKSQDFFKLGSILGKNIGTV